MEGERNDKLFRLAVQLRCITDNNEDHLLEILPRYGLGEAEMRRIAHCIALTARDFEGTAAEVRTIVADICRQFPLYK